MLHQSAAVIESAGVRGGKRFELIVPNAGSSRVVITRYASFDPGKGAHAPKRPAHTTQHRTSWLCMIPKARLLQEGEDFR
jgi:hypothetical protein